MDFQLTPEQQIIVDAPLAPLRVAAGAGTGKTTTIVLRLKALLAGGIEPEAALGITFTNKAAGELADRLRMELPSLTADGREVQVSTYHGFAYLLLQEFGALVGVERDTKIIGPAHQRQLIEEGLGEIPHVHLDLTNPRGVTDRAFTLAGAVGDNLLDVADVRNAAGDEVGDVWETRRELLSIVEAYQSAKQRLGVVDYSDLVGTAYRLVTDNPAIGRRIRNRYRVVLLDEYQDTDPAQRELLRTIFGEGFPVTAVGDSDQTIYEWRGASRLNFDGFVHHFPNPDGTPAVTLPLTLNRRSDRVILELANLIRQRLHGDEPFETLRAGPAARDGEIETGWLGTRDDEASWIAGRVADAHDDGTPWNEIAVLVRKNRDIGVVRDALTSAGIPTEVASIGGLLDVPEVVELLSWLRVLDDPSDRISVTRILLGSTYRLGLGDVSPLASWARESSKTANVDLTLIDAIEALEQIEGCSPAATQRLSSFRDRYRRLLVEAQHASIQDLCRSTLAAMDAWVEIDALDGHAAVSARLNLYRFLDLAETWKPLTGRPHLGSFLRYLEMLTEETAPTELDTATVDRGDAVSLLTIHRAKGLEWDVVIIPSVVEGSFPSGPRSYANPVDKAEYLPYRFRLDADTLPDLGRAATRKERNDILRSYHEAEEWRTAYVAVTRARRRLIVTGSHRSPGRKNPRLPSALFTMAAGLAVSNAESADPGPIDEPPWLPDAPAPDPLFGEDGWQGALRSAASDAGWLASYPEHADAARTAGEQMRLEIESLPRKESTKPAVARTTSVTGLVTLARCPLRFRWAFVDRLPTRPSTAMRRGVEFHRTLELHNLGKVPLEGINAIPHDGIASTDADPRARSPLDVFFASSYAGRRARFSEVPIDLQFGEVRVRGRIDAVYEPEAGSWTIVDYKSGRPSDDPALDVQLQTYAIAAIDGAVATPAPDRLTVTFAFFGGGSLTERSVDVNDEWLADARDRIDELTGLVARDEYEPTPADACERCDFASFCPAGKAYLGR